MGALEVREQDSSTLRTLTEPLKKRARLALVCAKKVMSIWCKCDSEDKRPQGFIKKSFACLDGEIVAQELDAEVKGVVKGESKVLGTSGAVFILGICVSLEEETEGNFLRMRKGDLKWQNFRKERWIH